VHGLNATAVAELARELTQLQELCLYKCNLQLNTAGGMACLAAIGRMTQLTCL
jgi:hypothetical protein